MDTRKEFYNVLTFQATNANELDAIILGVMVWGIIIVVLVFITIMWEDFRKSN